MKIPFAKLEKFVATEKDAKRILASLWLDVENKRLMATNGHEAARMTIELDESDVTGMIPVEAIELARKELKLIARVTKDSLPDPWLKVVANADLVVIENTMTNTTHLVTRPKLQAEEIFPPVDAVFPILDSKPTVTLSADYLADILAGIGAEGIALSFWISSPEKGVVIAADSGKAIAVLMPMRGSADPQEVNHRGEPITVMAR